MKLRLALSFWIFSCSADGSTSNFQHIYQWLSSSSAQSHSLDKQQTKYRKINPNSEELTAKTATFDVYIFSLPRTGECLWHKQIKRSRKYILKWSLEHNHSISREGGSAKRAWASRKLSRIARNILWCIRKSSCSAAIQSVNGFSEMFSYSHVAVFL